LTVLDFRSNSSPRSGRDRQQRRHLLVLLLMLGIVLILIDRARDPALWRWVGLLAPPPHEPAGSAAIDNRLDAAARSKSLPDAFLSPGATAGLSSSAENTVGQANRGTHQFRLEEALVPGEHLAAKPLASGKYFPGVEPAELDAIRDDTPSSRAEQTCSLRLLNILKTADLDTLRKASLGPVTYAQLFRQPDHYRGQLVTVSGIVRRANPIDLFANTWGIKQYYQVWLWPADNPSSPMMVYCLQLPKGFTTGMELAEQADVTGFFFKRCAYEAKDGLRTAPEILAGTLTWQRRPLMSPEPVETWAIPLVVGTAALVALLAAWYVYLRTRPSQPTLPDRPPDFSKLDNSHEKP
jgi:hypothetical protein